jgi:hypothetical protein
MCCIFDHSWRFDGSCSHLAWSWQHNFRGAMVYNVDVGVSIRTPPGAFAESPFITSDEFALDGCCPFLCMHGQRSLFILSLFTSFCNWRITM